MQAAKVIAMSLAPTRTAKRKRGAARQVLTDAPAEPNGPSEPNRLGLLAAARAAVDRLDPDHRRALQQCLGLV